MSTTINERIAYAIDELGLNKSTFANSIGKSPTTIQTIVNGRSEPGFKIIEAILKKYPQINPSWLTLGEGNFYRDTEVADKPQPEEADQIIELAKDRGDEYLMRHLASLEETNRSLARTVEAQSAQITTLLGKSRVAPMAV